MKKIIVLFAIFSFSFAVVLGQDRSKVQIKVVGARNPNQALLFVSQYASQKAPDAWRLVRSNPELIMKVDFGPCRTRSWTEIDQNARNRNEMLKTIDRTSRRAVRRIPYRYGKGWVRLGAQIGRDIVASKYIDNKYVVDKFRAQEMYTSVEITVYNPKTREVFAAGIGQDSIVVKTARVYGQEPITLLVSGDLSRVLDAGENLGNQACSMLQLSAFMNADEPANQLMN